MRQIHEQTLSKGKCNTIKPYAVAKRLLNIDKGIAKYCKDENNISGLCISVHFQRYVTSRVSDFQNASNTLTEKC